MITIYSEATEGMAVPGWVTATGVLPVVESYI